MGDGACSAVPSGEPRTEVDDPVEAFLFKPPCSLFGCEAWPCGVHSTIVIDAAKDVDGNAA